MGSDTVVYGIRLIIRPMQLVYFYYNNDSKVLPVEII